jgi:predicted GIY-YIG superfamily endonuclease
MAGRLRRGLEHPVKRGQLGVIYMLHFHQPYQHARHYVGWTEDLLDRLDRHAAGRGARLVEVIWQAGIGFTLVRICEGTRRTERAIKHAGGATRYCPGLHLPAVERPLVTDRR